MKLYIFNAGHDIPVMKTVVSLFYRDSTLQILELLLLCHVDYNIDPYENATSRYGDFARDPRMTWRYHDINKSFIVATMLQKHVDSQRVKLLVSLL